MLDTVIILLTLVGLLLTPFLTNLSTTGLVIYDVGCVLLGIMALVVVHRRAAQSRNSTRLVPGKLPRPTLRAGCEPTQDALVVLWGSNISWGTRMPRTILQMSDEPMLAIDRAPKGKGLVVTVLKIFDDRDEIIARLHEDGFWVKNTTRSHRPNPSTLVVYDQHDAEVLRVEFLNPTTLLVQGVFRKAGYPPMVITRESAVLGGMEISGNCIGNAAIDISV